MLEAKIRQIGGMPFFLREKQNLMIYVSFLAAKYHEFVEGVNKQV